MQVVLGPAGHTWSAPPAGNKNYEKLYLGYVKLMTDL